MNVALVLHVFMLQYLDLTLIGANSVTGIVAATILSTQVLGEVFIAKYDLTALFCISFGCFTLVLQANTTQTEYNAEQVVDVLLAPRTLCFLGFCMFCILLSACILRSLLRKLRQFEQDVE